MGGKRVDNWYFHLSGAEVCNRSRRRQKQPNSGAPKRGEGTKPKPGATIGGRRIPDRPSYGLLKSLPYCFWFRFLFLSPPPIQSALSPNPSSLSLSRSVLCFGGLVASLPGHTICTWASLNYVDMHATVEERLMSNMSSLGGTKTTPF